MKTNTLKAAAAVGLTALLMGSAAAQSVSKPVGYETITINQQFNYMGLRLVGSPVATGAVLTKSVVAGDPTGDITLDGATIPDGDFIIEANDGDAAGAVITGTAAGGVITVSSGILGDLEVGNSVTVRTPQTLRSIFGDPIESLDGAAGAGAADLILVPDGDGGFATYWYSTGGFGGVGAGWKSIDPVSGVSNDVTGTVNLVYTDGIIVQNRGANNELIVSGAVKTTPSTQVLTTQFNYLSTIYPAGATLSSAFDEPGNPGVLRDGAVDGAAGAGAADLIFVPSGAGFNVYWYSTGGFGGAGAGWKQLDLDTNASTDVVSTDVSLDSVSGIVVQNRGASDQPVGVEAPDFYSAL